MRSCGKVLLLSKAMSGSMVLLMTESMLMSMAYVTTEGHKDLWSVLQPEAMLMSMGLSVTRENIDVSGLCCHLRPW